MTNPSQHLPSGCSPQVSGFGSQDATAVTKVEMLVEYAERYELRWLVETGLWQGGGSGMGVVNAGAIREDHYIIVDWQPGNCQQAKVKYPAATVTCGDSAAEVPKLVSLFEHLAVPALWWLDAHGVESDVGFPPFPLWAELHALEESTLDHVILIDDLHMMGGHDWMTLRELRSWADGSRWDWTERHDIGRLTPAA